jgi:isopenicillin-N epimerase
VFPVERMTAIVRQFQPSAKVMIDGAHAPGMLGIDVQQIGADFYTGNCHKWLFAPKGTAFLWAAETARQEQFPHPCVVSSRGEKEFYGEKQMCFNFVPIP